MIASVQSWGQVLNKLAFVHRLVSIVQVVVFDSRAARQRTHRVDQCLNP